MALYFYHAFSKEGKKVSGFIDAPSLAQVKQQLSSQGMYPISITLSSQEQKQSWWRRLFGWRVPVKQKILFTRQLAVLLRSGVPLLQSLELLSDYVEGRLRTIVIAIKDEIKEGISFADALKKYPKVFPNLYVQLVRAGEASGNLEVILDRLVDYLERQEELRKKIRSALSGPLLQLTFAGLVVIVLVTYVVPTMAENFGGIEDLPAPTRFLMNVSTFVTHHYLMILIGLFIIIAALTYWARTKIGQRQLDRLKLGLPIIKYFARTGAVVQFSETLGMLLQSGVNLSESLDIVCNIVDNRILADTLQEARDKIIKQGRIAQYLKQTGIFPPIAIYLISTGEESGKLDQMLLVVAKNYGEELRELADSLSAKIGPILLVVMGVIVGFIVLSVAMPMLQMGQQIGI